MLLGMRTIDTDELEARLGPNLRRIRRNAELTQTQLADLIGIKQSDISRYERGESIPRGRRLTKLADKLNVDVAELFEKHIEDNGT